MNKLYSIKSLSKCYGTGGAKVTAIDDISLDLPEKRFVAILGASGSGKSTLLNMIGCMDKPTSGQILFKQADIAAYSKSKMTAFRAKNIGFVFQSYNLLPDLSALDNVEFSTEITGGTRADAKHALELVGLENRFSHYPAQLSGGEQQRVSIARAIAKKPRVLLCDEPTGALDYKTGSMVLGVLSDIQKKQETTVIFITHNKEIAKMADVVVTIGSGKIISLEENPAPINAAEVVW